MRSDIEKRLQALERRDNTVGGCTELIILQNDETEEDYYRDHPEIKINPNPPHLIIRISN